MAEQEGGIPGTVQAEAPAQSGTAALVPSAMPFTFDQMVGRESVEAGEPAEAGAGTLGDAGAGVPQEPPAQAETFMAFGAEFEIGDQPGQIPSRYVKTFRNNHEAMGRIRSERDALNREVAVLKDRLERTPANGLATGPRQIPVPGGTPSASSSAATVESLVAKFSDGDFDGKDLLNLIQAVSRETAQSEQEVVLEYMAPIASQTQSLVREQERSRDLQQVRAGLESTGREALAEHATEINNIFQEYVDAHMQARVKEGYSTSEARHLALDKYLRNGLFELAISDFQRSSGGTDGLESTTPAPPKQSPGAIPGTVRPPAARAAQGTVGTRSVPGAVRRGSVPMYPDETSRILGINRRG